MTTLAPLGTFEATLNHAYQNTRMGREIVDHLAAKAQVGRSGETLDSKERTLAAFALMHPNLTLGEVGTGECARFLATPSWKSGETRRVRRSHLNQLFLWAIRMDLIEKNPLDKLEAQTRGKKKTYDVFTDSEVEALCSLPVDGALFRVMFDAGLRRSECLNLQGRHVLPEPMPGQLRVVGGKGGKDRLIPMTRRLSSVLAEYRFVEGVGERDFFWYVRVGRGKVTRRDHRPSESSFHGWWVSRLERADVRYRNPHLARHTFATNYLRTPGTRLERLSLILGHESIATTADLYAHLDVRDLRSDMDLLEAFEE